MRPRRTPSSNKVFRLMGGNEDNDLWVRQTLMEGTNEPVIVSTWEISAKEREEIAAGANVELIIWGTEQPPVALVPTDEKLGSGR